jgi:hypothetical protein
MRARRAGRSTLLLPLSRVREGGFTAGAATRTRRRPDSCNVIGKRHPWKSRRSAGGLCGLDSQVFARTIEVPFEGSALRVVCREDFIARNATHLVRRVVRGFGRDAADVLQQILGSR